MLVEIAHAPRSFAWGLACVLSVLTAAGCDPADPEIPRVILVTIDTLRADHLPCYGYPRATAPFVCELAERGVRFDRALAPAPLTGPSHASMLTGLLPYQHGLLRNGTGMRRGVSLASRFQETGRATVAMVGLGFLDRLSEGFDHFTRVTPAAALRDEASRWLDEQPADARFFLWLHFFDVHRWKHRMHRDQLAEIREEDELDEDLLWRFLETQQGLSKRALERNSKRRALAQVGAYDALIRVVDRAIEDIYGHARHFDGATLWVVAGDHGEGLGAHSFLHHGYRIWQEQLRVPLIFHIADDRGGDIPDRRVVPDVAQLIDIAPTIAELTGLRALGHEYGGEGRSLASLVRGAAGTDGSTGRPVRSFAMRRGRGRAFRGVPLYSLQDATTKVLLSGPDAPARVFNLITDPLERHRTSVASVPSSAELVKELRRRVREAEAERTLSPAVVAPEHLAELRALGYIE